METCPKCNVELQEGVEHTCEETPAEEVSATEAPAEEAVAPTEEVTEEPVA